MPTQVNLSEKWSKALQNSNELIIKMNILQNLILTPLRARSGTCLDVSKESNIGLTARGKRPGISENKNR